ncbi:MAG: RidA family protein [Burkholderiales bacterium]|nr:RidA family protein [Burkholderiales bacterium]
MTTAIERAHTGPRMSKIVRHAGVVYLCGQTSSGSPAADATAQTHEVLGRIDALLREAGSGRGRLLAATVHLRDIADFAAMNAVWEAWLPPGAAPARTTVQALLAAPELRVEITVVAALA